jgi:hypothetical protein
MCGRFGPHHSESKRGRGAGSEWKGGMRDKGTKREKREGEGGKEGKIGRECKRVKGGRGREGNRGVKREGGREEGKKR